VTVILRGTEIRLKLRTATNTCSKPTRSIVTPDRKCEGIPASLPARNRAEATRSIRIAMYLDLLILKDVSVPEGVEEQRSILPDLDDPGILIRVEAHDSAVI